MQAVPKIILADQTPIAKGSEREIYLDPTDDTRLIKVMRPSSEQKLSWNFRGLSMRLLSNVRTRDISKEYREYLRLSLENVDQAPHLPTAHMHGFVPTDKGTGCLTQKVTTLNGDVAPTLKTLHRGDAMTAPFVVALNDMVRRMFFFNVRASDVTPANIVFGHRSYGSERAAFEAVLVDGFGDIHAIPIRTWSKWANGKALEESFAKVGRRAGLAWDSASRRFSL